MHSVVWCVVSHQGQLVWCRLLRHVGLLLTACLAAVCTACALAVTAVKCLSASHTRVLHVCTARAELHIVGQGCTVDCQQRYNSAALVDLISPLADTDAQSRPRHLQYTLCAATIPLGQSDTPTPFELGPAGQDGMQCCLICWYGTACAAFIVGAVHRLVRCSTAARVVAAASCSPPQHNTSSRFTGDQMHA